MKNRTLSQMSAQDILEASPEELQQHIQPHGSEQQRAARWQADPSQGTRLDAIAARRQERLAAATSKAEDLLTQIVAKPAHCAPRPSRPTRKALVRTPMAWTGTEPSFKLARQGGWFGFDAIHPKNLVHSMIVGASGSGKTESVVAPLLNGFLHYQLPCSKTVSILVIDPKRDLEAKVRGALEKMDGTTHRLVHIGGPDSAPVRFFDVDSPLTPRERLEHVANIADACTSRREQNRYWVVLGLGLLGDLMTLEDLYRRCKHGASLLTALYERLELTLPEDVGFWAAMQGLLAFARMGEGSLRRAISSLEDLCAELPHDGAKGVFAAYSTGSLIEQFNYSVMSVDPLLKVLSDPYLAEVVDADPWPDATAKRTDLAALIETGAVVLYQPTARPIDTLAAKAIKARFYSAVFSRQDLERPVAIVIDEAQRFVGDSPELGEASFIDRARAYRTNVVLATQSLSSIVHALGADHSAKATMEVLVANTPTKFFLQSKDTQTDAVLRGLIPPSPMAGAPHVVDIRPPAQLQTGEAYWSLPDGRFGRGRAVLEQLL